MGRKNQSKFLGNTLEKPGILLKKTFVRDTTFAREELGGDGEYDENKVLY